jgi:hypothetical protein
MTEVILPPPIELAILAGAGISISRPSNLLDGKSFMRNTLKSIVPSDVNATWALSALELPKARLRRPGEMLRFELLMHNLLQTRLDPNLSVLNCLDQCPHPNFNHYVLAELIRAGATVITTNFDRLIEIAWNRLHGRNESSLRVAAFSEDFPEDLPDRCPPTLWKLHGSLSIDGRDTRNSVQATMTSVLSTSMGARKIAFLSSVIRRRDLLVIGYSGWDDLDIVPVLGNSRTPHRLIWINHVTNDGPGGVQDASEMLKGGSPKFEIDAVGRDRVWFFRNARGENIRDPAKAHMISIETGAVLRQLAADLPSSGRYPIEETEFKFGACYPAEVQQYFDVWAQSLQGGMIGRYSTIASIHEYRQFRPRTREKVQRIKTTIQRLRQQSKLPADVLTRLIEEYNGVTSRDSPHRPSRSDLRERAKSLAAELPIELQGGRLRLLACIAWDLEGSEVGVRAFQEAAAFDRALGNREGELATLVSWRGHAGIPWWGETVPHEVAARMQVLADDLGYLPKLWQQELVRHMDFIDEEVDLAPIYNRLRRMQRHSIDVGDVLGEAQLAVQIGRLYLLDQQPGLALEEFLRVRELNRLLRRKDLARNVEFFLPGCEQRIGSDYAARMLPLIRQSMWAGRG